LSVTAVEISAARLYEEGNEGSVWQANNGDENADSHGQKLAGLDDEPVFHRQHIATQRCNVGFEFGLDLEQITPRDQAGIQFGNQLEKCFED